MTLAINPSLEGAVDIIAELLIGPEFIKALSLEHERMRRHIPLRVPEVVYTEDVQTPSAYPCAELIAIGVTDEPNASIAELQHEISCQWTVNGDDEQIMGRELKRLIAATRQLFRYTSMLPELGGSVWTGDVDFGPVVTPRAQQGSSDRWIKSGSIQIFWKAFIR